MPAANGKALAPQRVDHEAIWGPLAILALLAARFFPFDLVSLGFCPWRALTGIPCPTCGGTRCMMELTRLDLPAALAMNPLVALAGLGAAAYAVHALGVWLLGWRRWRPSVSSPRAQRALRIGAVTALLLNWAYLILVGR
jgi:hypothetical protein